MKSKVFGYNAKLALAVLAICGTMFTSCYEKEDVDQVNPPTEESYYITGSVVNGATSAAITNYDVTITPTATVTKTGSAFSAKVSAAGTYTVKVTATGYKDVERTVVLVKVGTGQVSIANADIAMFDASSLPPVDPETPPAAVTPSAANLSDAGFPAGTTPINGGAQENKVETLPSYVTEELTVAFNRNEGFIIPTSGARGINEDILVRRSIEDYLGKKYVGSKYADFIQTPTSITIPLGSYAAVGYTLIRTFASKEFKFNIEGKAITVTAYWEDNQQIVPKYDPHHGGGGGSN